MGKKVTFLYILSKFQIFQCLYVNISADVIQYDTLFFNEKGTIKMSELIQIKTKRIELNDYL